MQASVEPARVALAHDWLVGLRGGEHVLDAIVRALAGIGTIDRLYTMFDDSRGLTPRIDALPKEISSLSSLPGALRRWLLPLYPAAVRQLSDRLAHAHASNPIDIVISTSSAAIKGLRPPAGVPHLCYCHTPARYLWSQADAYARESRLRGLGLSVFGPRLREWDRATASNVTRFLANSTHTAREIQRCYGRESVVVFPPVRTTHFTPPPPGASRGTHWLVVSALEPYKRTDLAILAANARAWPLRIVGDGSDASRLRAIAGPTVTFLGRVDDDALREEYRGAGVLLSPQIEDFGIISVEAQACGLPVAARRGGGALDTVVDAQSGVLFDGAEPAALAHAADACAAIDPGDCVRNAARFSEEVFREAIRREVHAMLARR